MLWEEMDNKNKSKDSDSNFDQLKKYAKDLSEIYKSEKARREEIKTAYQQLMNYAGELNKTVLEVKDKNKELHEAYIDTIHRLVLAAEFKDEDTGDHIERMSRYSALIAEKLGLSTQFVGNTLYAAPMHDVGKIGIPDGILLKPAKLTDEEFEIMKTHPSIGAKILANSKAEILQFAHQIAISHHEKWNGKGYPNAHSGEKIPLVGRIVSLADTFDALTSRRPYKDPYPIEVALDIIRKERGEHFDPDVVDVFLRNIGGIISIKKEVDLGGESAITDFEWSERDQ